MAHEGMIAIGDDLFYSAFFLTRELLSKKHSMSLGMLTTFMTFANRLARLYPRIELATRSDYITNMGNKPFNLEEEISSVNRKLLKSIFYDLVTTSTMIGIFTMINSNDVKVPVLLSLGLGVGCTYTDAKEWQYLSETVRFQIKKEDVALSKMNEKTDRAKISVIEGMLFIGLEVVSSAIFYLIVTPESEPADSTNRSNIKGIDSIYLMLIISLLLVVTPKLSLCYDSLIELFTPSNKEKND
ncbi:MAG: hypothetical protein CL521_05080 [Actinobacteria bacterium]|nr:hypothetical protein [Actinomycetota bacterium]|tara:strand:- start:626 stop:1351 length:726 start_codon:yes stop_codon:yes gene_type:complete